MTEPTLIKTMPLPYGQDWAWYADANLVVLAPGLCPAARERALEAVSTHWRRNCLRVVRDGGPYEPETTHPTQPLADLPMVRV